MFFRKNNTIAKERLELMIEAESLQSTPDHIKQAKKEISQIINRYFDISYQYEIKIIVKDSEKRE